MIELNFCGINLSAVISIFLYRRIIYLIIIYLYSYIMNINFQRYLEGMGFHPKDYLNQARTNAWKHGYEPEKIEFNEDEKSEAKLIYEGVGFGRVGYKDFLIWRHLEKVGEVPRGTAKKRQVAYLARSTNIRGSWRNDPLSRNNLAIAVLWDGTASPL